MKNVSNEFRQLLQTDERHYLAYADIILADGTGFSLDNSQIWAGGLSYEETVSEDNQFTAVGSVIIGSSTLIINNINEFFSSYDFTNADVVLYIGMQLSDRVERIKIGTYRVDEAVYNGGTVTLKLLDYIEQLDRPYTSSALSYPATLQDILVDACYNCGILLYNYDFPNRTFTVQNAPDSKESTTFREVVSWVATLAGCFVKCTPDGKLAFQWFDTNLINQYQTQTIYDGGTFNPWTTGDIIDGGTFNPWTTEDIIDGGAFTDLKYIPYVTNLNSQNIDLDDIVITGVSVTIENNNDDNDTLKYSAGTDDYEIVINANPFITKANAQTIIDTLGNQLIGLRFRRLNITHIDDPTLEAGDIGIVVDRKQNNYFTLITRVSFTVGSLQTVVCGAATPCRNSVTKYSTQTRNYLKSRKVLKEEQSLRTLLQWDLNAKISSMSGLYTTVESVSGGGNIFYLHDKPTLNESKVVWKMTAEAWSVTNNYKGSQTQWTAGLTVDGTLIAQIMSTIGINFDWGTGGTLKLGGDNNVNGSLTVYDKYEQLTAAINSNGFLLSRAEFVCRNDYSTGPNSYIKLYAGQIVLGCGDSSDSTTRTLYMRPYQRSLSINLTRGTLNFYGPGDCALDIIPGTAGSSTYCWNFTGTAYFGHNVYANVYPPSDERLKNISNWNPNIEKFLLSLSPIVFTWKNKDKDSDYHVGLSAQETKKLLEKYNLADFGLVHYISDTYSINYTELVPMMLHTIQRLSKENNELKEQLEDVNTRLKNLEDKIQQIL